MVRLIGEAFEPELRNQFKKLLTVDTTRSGQFPTLQSLFERTFQRLALRFNLRLSERALAQRLSYQLAHVPAYPESAPVLERLEKSYRICIVSDGDTAMVRRAISLNGLGRFPVVISEEHRAYKITPNTPLFKKALDLLGTSAEETIHIGDQASDVYGADQCGLDCVYLNRSGRPLPAGVPPPLLEVNSLRAFEAWLTSH